MVRYDRAGIAAGRPTFIVGEPFTAGSTSILDESAARHIRVLRLDAGAMVGLRDGLGNVGEGQLVRISRTQVHVEVLRTAYIEPPPEVHVLVPVADRDRMLWLAEKAAELSCTSWRPVIWRRSRSVSPRGEGKSFQAKVRLRMLSAIAQSEGAWLPQLFPEATLERALLAAPQGKRFVLDPMGHPMTTSNDAGMTPPVTVAIGPEGGIEPAELTMLQEAGFQPVNIGPTILRFETAAIVALGIARTWLSTRTSLLET